MNTVNILWNTVEVTDRPYHHGALESALLDAAMQVVTNEGIGALSLRDLARTLGVSPSATYRHFPSREHLVAAVSQRAREQLALAMIAERDAVPATGTKVLRSIRRFEATGRAYVTFALASPHRFEAAFVPSAVRPTRAEDPNAWSVLEGAVDEMVRTGAVPMSRRHEAPLIAWAGVHGLSTILTGSVQPAEASVDLGHRAAIDTVIAGIVRAIR